MPAPVTFNLTLAPLPVNFTGTPQQWAQAVIDRLTIAPSAPWSSFQNGGSIPTSDVGPILFNGVQWKVWNSATGEYVDLVVDGGGLVARTVTLAAMATQSPGSLFYYDASGNPAALAPATQPTGPNWISGATYVAGQYVTYSGVVYRCILAVSGTTAPNADATHWTANSGTTTGDVLTQSSAGLPVWLALPPAVTSSFVEVTTNADFGFTTDGSQNIVPFNTVKTSNGVIYDTTNFRIPVPANSTWMFWASVELSDTATASTGVVVVGEIRPNGTPGIGVGGSLGWQTAINQTGIPGISGVLSFTSAGYVDFAISATETTPQANGLTVNTNNSLTRFGGVRLF